MGGCRLREVVAHGGSTVHSLTLNKKTSQYLLFLTTTNVLTKLYSLLQTNYLITTVTTTTSLLFACFVRVLRIFFSVVSVFFSQFANSPRGDSRRHYILWWYHVNKYRAMRGNRE